METGLSYLAIPGEVPESLVAPRRTRFQEVRALFLKNWLAMAGLAVFIAFFLFAITGLCLTSGRSPILDPAQIRLYDKLRPPMYCPGASTLSAADRPAFGIYLLGTDELGRDVFSRMLQGAWVSLTVGFVAVGISLVVGIFLGGLAGYYGSRGIRLGHVLAISVDTVIMRFVDIMLCFPSFFLILTVVALTPPSIYNIMIVIGLTSWMGATRFVRAEFLSLREQDFVTAARVLGVGDLRIIFRHMMPNAVAPVFVSATIGIASAIELEAGLSFLGLGVPPPHATWGNILSDGKAYIFDAPWLTFAPGLAILVVVLAFNLLGEGLREALNPKLRQKG